MKRTRLLHFGFWRRWMSAQLFTRAWPVTGVHEAFDRWQLEKHLPDLVQGPGILRAAYYRTVLEGLPEAYHGSGSCMARYTASTLDDLLTWLRSPVVPAAIEDGSRWFGSFNELDGSTYTGNVYREVAALGPDDPTDDEPDLVFVERFEVPPDEAEEFDRWLLDRHMGPGRPNSPVSLAPARSTPNARTFRSITTSRPGTACCRSTSRRPPARRPSSRTASASC